MGKKVILICSCVLICMLFFSNVWADTMVGTDENKSLFVNRIKDPANLTELEKKHVPVIHVGTLDSEKKTLTITVKVGETIHPMEEKHYIKYIELFIDGKSEGKVELKPGDKPEAVFNVGDLADKRVTAREECNIHGIWEDEVK